MEKPNFKTCEKAFKPPIGVNREGMGAETQQKRGYWCQLRGCS